MKPTTNGTNSGIGLYNTTDMDSDSDSEVRPGDSGVKDVKQKSRRPPNTAFRQQRLKAWQPILTPKTVLPLFFCIAVVFAPIGGLLLYASNQVQELIIDYSHCLNASSSYENIPSKYITQHFAGGAVGSNDAQWRYDSSSGSCFLQFDIPKDMPAPVYMYYKMTNFYQNHRRYVQSYSEDQLNGKAVSAHSLRNPEDCKPLTTDAKTGKPIYPCGLIANSYFNDTLSEPVLLNSPGSSQDNTTYAMTTKGIAWSTDKNRFKKTTYKASEVVPPPNWAKMYPDGYTDENLPDIAEWESLQNWMRTAGLATFSKLARRNDNTTLQSGTYMVNITYNFPVLEYHGTKSLVLTTRTVIGGRNPFLGIAYLVVAGICFALGFLFLIKHFIKPRKLGDHAYLTWNNDNQAAQGHSTARNSVAGSQRRM